MSQDKKLTLYIEYRNLDNTIKVLVSLKKQVRFFNSISTTVLSTKIKICLIKNFAEVEIETGLFLIESEDVFQLQFLYPPDET